MSPMICEACNCEINGDHDGPECVDNLLNTIRCLKIERTINSTQTELAAWQTQNFDPPFRTVQHMLHRLSGEVGEASQAYAKFAEHELSVTEYEAALRDAIGDIAIVCMQICTQKGWYFGDVIISIANEVMQRKR